MYGYVALRTPACWCLFLLRSTGAGRREKHSRRTQIGQDKDTEDKDKTKQDSIDAKPKNGTHHRAPCPRLYHP